MKINLNECIASKVNKYIHTNDLNSLESYNAALNRTITSLENVRLDRYHHNVLVQEVKNALSIINNHLRKRKIQELLHYTNFFRIGTND